MAASQGVLVVLVSCITAYAGGQQQPRGARVDLSRVRPGDLASQFGLAQDPAVPDKPEEQDQQKKFERSELDRRTNRNAHGW